MSGINAASDKKSVLIIAGVIAAVAGSLFAYLMWYVAPEENIEQVKIVAVTESGCIAETMDGFAVNIGECNAEPGDFVMSPVDKKAKERAAAMNPTR